MKNRDFREYFPVDVHFFKNVDFPKGFSLFSRIHHLIIYQCSLRILFCYSVLGSTICACPGPQFSNSAPAAGRERINFYT